MKIAILGYGVEGKAAEQYFRAKYPQATLEIFDKIDFGATDFAGFDLVVRTPSIAPRLLQSAQHVTTNTIEFFAECPCPIIGVTGTKGKSTTAALLAAILEQLLRFVNTAQGSQRQVYLLGNFGVPALSTLGQIKTDDVVVYELSSFQLWDLEQSPPIAVYTPIAVAHLDVHHDLEDYLAAKRRLSQFQQPGDTVVQYGENPDFDTSSLQLRGEHNRQNALSAIAAARAYNQRFLGLDETDFATAVQTALAQFGGLPHRLELVRELGKVRFYDDSISTALPAFEVALESFDEPLALIAGGYDNQAGNEADFAKAIEAAKNLRFVALIGTTGKKLAELLPVGLARYFATLEEAVKAAYAAVRREPSGVVLLSPGAPSFGLFKDYKERGQQFQALVQELQ